MPNEPADLYDPRARPERWRQRPEQGPESAQVQAPHELFAALRVEVAAALPEHPGLRALLDALEQALPPHGDDPAAAAELTTAVEDLLEALLLAGR